MKPNPKVKAFTLQIRLAKLRLKHRKIKAKIATELNRGAPCDSQLHGLKQQRLGIRHEMVECLSGLRQIAQPAAAQRPN
ncbi:DUF465 domain-containing protein [Phaeobacter sp.]|uniref:DUF465 domain-containing protein n=1 Tax=Phaeobacter sp. TaxID=1902409 RepID=UPI0025E9E717|nr:DUF465 domain-containing protein [Phaeobacter sp.]